MRTLLCLSLLFPGCDDTTYFNMCPQDALVIEIGTSTLGDDGIHEQGESCYTVDPKDGSIDYTACCPEGWEYAALGSEGGILCQWDSATNPSCPRTMEVAEYSDTDGVTKPLENCPVTGRDGSTDYNECCPAGYDAIALGPNNDTVICER